MVREKTTLFCKICKKTMDEGKFYTTHNTEKYPTGHLDTCKDCTALHVDNWNPDTYLWILKEVDVPYVPDEWNNLLRRYGKDRSQVTGTTILGRYLGKMRLKEFKDFRWKDNDFLQELKNSRIEQSMRRQGYSQEEIARTVATGQMPIVNEPPPPPIPKDEIYSNIATGNEDYFAEINGDNDDYVNSDLTDDERKMLRLKWGKSYKPEEWVSLEQLYQEMEESYDIQGAGHEDILKMVCKTSLKANQLLDIGDRIMFP